MIAYPLIKLIDSIGGLVQQLPAEGRTFTPGEVDQERTGRVSSGKLVTDLLTSKDKFSIKFERLDGDVFERLIELRRSNNDLTMQYQKTYSGVVQVKTVRIVAPVSGTRAEAWGVGAYEDVTLEIEEV